MESELNVIIDTMKTTILVCSRENNIRTRMNLRMEKTIEQEHDFRYCGDTLSSNWILCEKKIWQAKVAFTERSISLTWEILILTLGKSRWKCACTVRSIVLYTEEKHIAIKKKKKKIGAFEKYCNNRRNLKISRTDGNTRTRMNENCRTRRVGKTNFGKQIADEGHDYNTQNE